MTIKDLLVHLDETPASERRLQAALALAAACGAQLSALYLIAEPFLPGMGGRHLPAELLREHLAHAEAEAEAVLAAATAAAERLGTTLAVLRASGPAGPAATAAGAPRPLHGPDHRRPGRPRGARGGRHGADRGGVHGQRPAGAGDPARRCDRAAATARDRGLGRLARGSARRQRRDSAAPGGAELVLVVDARDAGDHPGAELVAHLVRHEVKAELRQVASGGPASPRRS